MIARHDTFTHGCRMTRVALIAALLLSPAVAQDPKPAEEVYKNIQIMKGVPAARIPGVMTNLTKWLGVDCAYCHVPGAFEKDDKPTKEAARKMFAMVRKIRT